MPAEPGPPTSKEGMALRSALYWTERNVTASETFPSAEASLAHFHWRSAQYHNYLDLMPVSGHDGKVVLDLGCGPGNDLVGLGVLSRPRRLLGADVSTVALELARSRARLHGLQVELEALPPDSAALPYADASIDYVHCSGVIHHVADDAAMLSECRRVLRSTGEMRVMVYNHDSVWLHLYVAYGKQIVEGTYANLDVESAFSRTTDGPECPIARTYRPEAFLEAARQAGFSGSFVGAAVSMWEMTWFPRRFEAIMDRRLPAEHRDFLSELTLDDRGYPLLHGRHAGIGACYALSPAQT